MGPPQPDYVNGCALLAVALGPEALLERLLATERRFGRVRGERWGTRHLDLDLLLVGDQRLASPRLDPAPTPQCAERAFVLVPLAEIAPAWIDPVSGRSVAELAAALRGEGGLAALEDEQVGGAGAVAACGRRKGAYGLETKGKPVHTAYKYTCIIHRRLAGRPS